MSPEESLRPKVIMIKIVNGTILIEERTRVSRTQRLRWENAGDFDFDIDFGNNSPFKNSKFTKEEARAGVFAEESALVEHDYKYTVRADGIELDPIIIIRPDPPSDEADPTG